MKDPDGPRELHTEADEEEPLSEQEAVYMGNQVDKKLPGVPPSAMLVYGEADGPETEDQYDANHVEEGEHL